MQTHSYPLAGKTSIAGVLKNSERNGTPFEAKAVGKVKKSAAWSWQAGCQSGCSFSWKSKSSPSRDHHVTKANCPPLYFQSQRLQPHKAEEVKQSKALEKVNDTVEIEKREGRVQNHKQQLCPQGEFRKRQQTGEGEWGLNQTGWLGKFRRVLAALQSRFTFSRKSGQHCP